MKSNSTIRIIVRFGALSCLTLSTFTLDTFVVSEDGDGEVVRAARRDETESHRSENPTVSLVDDRRYTRCEVVTIGRQDIFECVQMSNVVRVRLYEELDVSKIRIDERSHHYSKRIRR